jgi:apolipoprotein N-acyltransferase
LGPFFALKIRQAGRSAGRAGWTGYHLALAGLLLVILANLVSLILNTSDDTARIATSIHSALLAAILLGLVSYILGLFFLYRAAPPARAASGWAALLLLVFLPLAIPLTFVLPFITWRWPVSELYGIPLLWELPQDLSLSLGVLWLALSVWVVTQEGHSKNTLSILPHSVQPVNNQ